MQGGGQFTPKVQPTKDWMESLKHDKFSQSWPKKGNSDMIFCFLLKCILNKFNLDQSESTDQSVDVCCLLCLPDFSVVLHTKRQPSFTLEGMWSTLGELHMLRFSIPFWERSLFPYLLALLSRWFSQLPVWWDMLLPGRVVFEGKISHEDHFNRVSFGWTKPGWPLVFCWNVRRESSFFIIFQLQDCSNKNAIPSTVHKSQWVVGGVLLGF